jgi:CubicO group peptidase (beta-lactamase class C family)
MSNININTLSAATSKQLQQLINRNLDDVFPAMALAVIHHGEWAMDAAWGWIDPQMQQFPVTSDTLFDLASVTKIFTSMTFLSLVSAGKIDLNDPVVKIIPEFGQSGPRSMDGGQDPHTKAMLPTPASVLGQTVDPTKVTFRQLLTHTSGLSAWRHVYQDAGPAPTPPNIPDPLSRDERWSRALAAICNHPFVGQPGDLICYSDLGLMLLGGSISRLHGTLGKLDIAVQERLLNPLELQSLTYNPIQNGHDHNTIAPTEYDAGWRKRRCWGEVHDENSCGVGGVAGHAGLFGTAVDVARFGQACLESDTRLGIAPQLMTESKQEHVETGGMRRGLGWLLKAHKGSPAGDLFSPDSYGHTGFTGTSLWIDPQRELIVACFTNRVYPGRDKPGIVAFRRAVHDIIVEGLYEL